MCSISERTLALASTAGVVLAAAETDSMLSRVALAAGACLGGLVGTCAGEATANFLMYMGAMTPSNQLKERAAAFSKEMTEAIKKEIDTPLDIVESDILETSLSSTYEVAAFISYNHGIATCIGYSLGVIGGLAMAKMFLPQTV